MSGVRRFRTSIRDKLILFLLAAIALPTLSSIAFTYAYTKHSVENNAIRENTELMRQGAANLRSYLDSLNRASLLVYNDMNNPRSLFKLLESGATDYATEMEIASGLRAVAQAARGQHQIALYSVRAGQTYIVSAGKLFKGASSTGLKPASERFDAQLEPTHPSHGYGAEMLSYEPPKQVLSLHRPVYRIPRRDLLGWLSIDVRIEKLLEIVGGLYDPEREELYILDHDGRVLLGPDPGQWGKPLGQADWIGSLSRPEGGYLEWSDSDFSGMLIYTKIEEPFTQLQLVKRIPYSTLYAEARRLAGINAAVLAGFLVLALAATVWISVRMTEPIRRLIRSVNQIQSGNLEAPIDVEGRDEIGTLARKFRDMMHSINRLILREYRLELANKTNQLRALQAQVNPHFLYNALQSIGTQALKQNAPDVYGSLTQLAKMMRYSMDTSSTLVPLQAELEHVRSYLELQRMRFGSRMEARIEAPEEALTRPIPKMTLQPVVENAFKHAFPDGPAQGRVTILSRDDPWLGVWDLVVEDNGIGLNQSELAAIRHKLAAAVAVRPASGGEGGAAEEREGSGIGLPNVLLRLRYLIDENCRVILEPGENGQGLRVTLRLPLPSGAGQAGPEQAEEQEGRGGLTQDDRVDRG
ncbi:sensor histidine kinase [Paenibacillus thermoaerophilus]|uniref:Sensor histidine kinase n=1 Tax=Paenibacillus thermoaerophilus TaxID=1215385 RepID=A0ABW2V304_9BACL|nr:sensor histidine kinase [Paenibacillus thermoaerophilus]TMV11017.1 sensor histidine kinase [Paenibacillus thermoaerophilus]